MLHMPSRSDIGSCLASGDAAQARLPNNSLKLTRRAALSRPFESPAGRA
jgi:hypothetical protein